MTCDLPVCPAAGTGAHSWVMSAAHHCRRRGMSGAEAVQFIAARISRPPSPPNEIESAVSKAYRTPTFSSAPRPYPNASRPALPLSAIKFDEARLRVAAAKIVAPANWRHWLWERSPKRPEAMNGYSFLAQLYEPDEKVHLFDVFERKCPLATVIVRQPMDCRVPALIRSGGRYAAGIWYLCNPVDGRWHPNPRENNLSCRSQESITAFRYAVLESDQAPPHLWLGFIAQLPTRVAAIYTSGGRSIHTLIRLDAKLKSDWDEAITPLKRPLAALGADAGALSAVRLSRLPGCWRPEKAGFQRLLYLYPDPALAPLIDLPIIQSRSQTLARWRRDCPRWNWKMGAFA